MDQGVTPEHAAKAPGTTQHSSFLSSHQELRASTYRRQNPSPHLSPTKLLTFQGPAGGTSTVCALHSSEDSCATSTAPSTCSLIAISIPRAQPITESAAMFAQAALRCVFYDRSKQQTVRHKKLCAPGVGACIVPHRHAQGIKAAS